MVLDQEKEDGEENDEERNRVIIFHEHERRDTGISMRRRTLREGWVERSRMVKDT